MIEILRENRDYMRVSLANYAAILAAEGIDLRSSMGKE